MRSRRGRLARARAVRAGRCRPPTSGSSRRSPARSAVVLERSRLAGRAADAQRLREADAVRTALLAAVSHDLRTPLATIKAADLEPARSRRRLVRGGPRRSCSPRSRRPRTSSTALLSNLLDLSRLQAGALPAVLRGHSGRRGRVGSTDRAARRPCRRRGRRVAADGAHRQGLLERVVANLIENAVRHSPPGLPVRVFAGLIEDGTAVELRIMDRGPGVAESDRERMFVAFQRLGDSPAGQRCGPGPRCRPRPRGDRRGAARGRGHPRRWTHDGRDAARGHPGSGPGGPAMTRVLVVDDEPATGTGAGDQPARARVRGRARHPTAARPSTSPPGRTPTSSCSTWACPTSTASR